jgi:aromatic-L-amino-acid/L-tryptophan decarboxylase
MTEPVSLDPEDWSELRALGHRMVDDMIDYLAEVRTRPVWQMLPAELRDELGAGLPAQPVDAEMAYADFRRLVQPYATGNVHPRFMGWVHGGGNPVGMLAELLAGGLNANLGGRDHAPIEVERQVIRWTAAILGLPEQTSGLLVTGSSIANMIAVLVARTAALGAAARRTGLRGARLAAYTSDAAHGCIPRALDMTGLGSDSLRAIPCDAAGRMDQGALDRAVARDRDQGAIPFLVVGTAGTVNTGAVDDLAALARFCRSERIWFHVDGAFGAMAALSPVLRPLVAGIEQADSVALDFHKWVQVPYDAGCILVRDPEAQLAAFAQPAAYLRRETRGLAGGHPWPCDLGPDLSRGFRALKVWMTLKVYGVERLGAVVAHTCELARALADRVDAEPALERLAPVALNIVCFRFTGATDDLDRLNADIVADLQESGVAAPSVTTVGGKRAIRAAIVNHRTRLEDVEALIAAVLAIGRSRIARAASGLSKPPPPRHVAG